MDAVIREAALTYDARKPLPPEKITFEEFMSWCDEDTWAEWVDGEVAVFTPASRKHQDVKGFLYSVIREFLYYKKTGCVLNAPFLVRLPDTLCRGREPDLLYVSNEKFHLLKETFMDGAPDLIVEIFPGKFGRGQGREVCGIRGCRCKGILAY